jgi:hypothetical protein
LYVRSFLEPFTIGFTTVTLVALTLSPQIMTSSAGWEKADLVHMYDYTISSHLLVTFVYNYIFCYMRSIHDENGRLERFHQKF